MEELPDIVGPDPAVVFCGQAGQDSPKTREHYYATPGNSFWECLHLAGMTPTLLRPEDDHRLPALGLGLTDLVGRPSPDGTRYLADIDDLVAKVERWEPDWLAFTGKGAAQQAARALGRRPPKLLGATEWYVGRTQVFVLPGPSGANRRPDYDGRPTRVSWWRELAEMADLADLAGPDLEPSDA
ncbi:G/U mismatch-specific DNA glycosylase [Nocardioides aquaticus]|uniref:G/U mismatch-specific DNA glycosylase n=1 Tax=Nocardioides aquaticus TaxID=160826 RepID=A0ABX8EN22_9ACTN|nr:mismatch-specific DNA-glycosylase [Nocardioides aquaticus]QVT81517.1 G/U mismatch-specific DNA glycosylase [Nocardioides aquaticus]